MKTNVKELRKRMIDKGIGSISDLAKATGISRATLSSVLNGKTQPSSVTMAMLVKVLEITPEEAGVIFFNADLRTAQELRKEKTHERLQETRGCIGVCRGQGRVHRGKTDQVR